MLWRTQDIKLRKLGRQLKIKMHRVLFEMPEYWFTRDVQLYILTRDDYILGQFFQLNIIFEMWVRSDNL